MALAEQPLLEYASANRPCAGEKDSGDSTVILPLENGLLVAIVDVLGHGREAHQLTHVINSYLERYPSSDVCGLMKRLHQHLQGSRGAAVGLCAINHELGLMEYAGIGNTTIRRFGGTETRLVSKEGVLGQNMRSPLHQCVELSPGDVIVLYTDGISDRFTTADYPGVLRHTSQEIATNIVKRFGKNHDDAACIAVKYRP